MASHTRGQTAGTKKTGARKRLRLWLLFVVAFMVWAGYTLVHQTLEVAGQKVQLDDRQKLVAKTEAERDSLKQEIAKLNDDEYLGQMARKKLDLYPPGEKAIRR